MKHLISNSVCCALLLTLFSFGCAADPGIASTAGEIRRNQRIMVGSVDMERLFHSYAKTAEFYEKAGEIQLRFQEIEEEDFEQMMQLQGEFQLMQQELFRNFQDDVEKTAKTVSEEKNLDLIAVEVLYRSGKTELADVTDAFMESDLFSEAHIHSESCGPECE